MNEKIHRRPRGFREDPDTLVLRCPHRDLSCCDECAQQYPGRILEVHGERFWMLTDLEREETLRALAVDS
jgi:hypothetical protein